MHEKRFYDLTNPQKSIWYTEEVFKGTTINNICTSGVIYERVDESLLKKAINLVVEQNDSFRIHIINDKGSVKQYISEYKNFDIEVEYINIPYELDQIEEQEAIHHFDFFDSDLYKFKIVICKDILTCIILTASHIISDSWSMGITIQEILKNYYNLKNNANNDIESFSYIDYINSENEYKLSKKFEVDKNYWKDVFKTLPEHATIPSTVDIPKVVSSDANRLDFNIDENIVKKINNFCKEHHFSVFSFLMAVFSIYIGRVSSNDDFVIGTPILNRTNYKEKHTTGMFVNTAPVRITNINSGSFLKFVNTISKNMMGVLRHQKYSYTSVLEDLREKHGDIPKLYNILISYQVTKAFDKSIGKYTTNWTFNHCCSDDIDIHISDINDTGNLLISYDYLICKYCVKDIQKMHKRIINIINQVITSPDILTSDIEIVTEKEKNKLIYDFNKTSFEYPADKTIVDLFEEQVEKTPNNIAIVFGDAKLTYKELNEKSNSLAYYLRNEKKIMPNNLVGIMCNRSIEMIIAILAVLKAGGAYIPIDPTFPKDRIDYMLEESSAKLLLTQEELYDNIDFKNKLCISMNNLEIYTLLNENLAHVNTPNDLAYVIFTSGSTGKPKGVMLKHKSLTNLANYCNNYIDYLKNPKYKAVASITTVSFDIFIFETLISLQKGLKLVIANENEQNLPNLLNDLILKHNIKIIQTTPSRMQIFVNNKIPALKNLEYITLAGEQLPLSLVANLKSLNNATIYNGYGPSETTVFSTLTKMDDKITIGKPLYNTQIYILDNNLKPVPVGVSGEIYISGDGVGKGYLNNPNQTSKSFINNPFIPDSIMYKTGDIGKFLPNGEIICLGRSDNQVKIRGLRIELGEIEDRINELHFIDSCVVVKKVDSESHEFLCAYFTSQESVNSKDIRKYLEKFLPRYMVPTFFVQMKSLPYTPNGKIDRKKLPEPQVQNLSKNIVLPRDNTDSKLIDLLKNLLKIDMVSIDDNFFDLGGDSLSAINLCAQVQKEFNTQIYVRDIIENPEIQYLSDIIKSKNSGIETPLIKPVQHAEFYDVSSAQKRIYYACQMAGKDSIVYNVPGGIILDGIVDIEKFENCVNTLINRHESLRTYFELQNDTVVQKVIDNYNFKLNIIDNADYDSINSLFKDFVKPFDLSCAPLFRLDLVKFTNGKYSIFVDMHHIVSDGTSLTILIDELCDLYNGETLSELKITYKDFANFENKKIKSGLLEDAENYWLEQFKPNVPVLNMPTSYTRPAVQSYNGDKIYSVLDEEVTKKILDLCRDLGITPYMFLLSCFYILLSKYTSQDDIVIGSPIVGRNIAETYNLIGMFTNTLALRNTVDNNLSFEDFALKIKESVLDSFKYQSYPFDELVNKLHINRDTSRNPLFDIMFIYQNNGYKDFHLKDISTEYFMPNTNISKFDLSLEAIPKYNQIALSFEYATDLFDENFIINLSSHYLNTINDILDNSNIKISDICMLSEDEKNTILYEFNNTVTDFPKYKNIVQLFEEQVEKTPDNIAVVFKNQKLTYRELNGRINQFARFLKGMNIQRKDKISICLPKSIDLMCSIFAILKLGSCYVPISPEYPVERIKHILENSNSKVLITSKNQNTVFDNCLYIDDLSNLSYLDSSNLNIDISPNDLCYIIYTSGSTGKPKGVTIAHSSLLNYINWANKFYCINKPTNFPLYSSIGFDLTITSIFTPLVNGGTVLIYPDDDILLTLKDIFENSESDIVKLTPAHLSLLNDFNFSSTNVKKLIVGGDLLSPEICRKVTEKFKNIEIYNEYGPTEATVGCMIYKYSLDSDKYNSVLIGYPIDNVGIYILDNYLNPVPIGVTGEIYITGAGLSKGYLGHPDLTSKSFIPNPYIKDSLMYKTGDIGMFTPSGDIICLGRIDNQVKIRGYRIELSEIADRIYELPFIKNCVVIKKSNTQFRDFLCAYFTANISISSDDIRRYLEKYLPKYMIPSFFIQMASLPYTINGKINTKALPEPQHQHSKKDIIEPRNKIDYELINLLKKLLNIDTISIDDNFFELGGDSLSAINLCSQIQNRFDVQLFVRDVLENPVIKDLSDIVSKNPSTSKKNRIKPIEHADFYCVSSSQKRIYFVSKMAGENSTLYNVPGGIILDGNINVALLEKCINMLIQRHEAFRTYFVVNDNSVVQKIAENVDFKLNIINDANFEDINSLFKSFVKPFDLSIAPLFRATLIHFSNEKSAIFVDMHHIISDATSLSIFTDELCKLYNGETLPELNITYKDFSAFEQSTLKSGLLESAENYWLKQFRNEIPVLNMPTSFPRPAVQSFDGKKIYSLIDESTTQKIEQIAKKLDMTPYMILLSCYYILLSKYTSQDDIVIGSPIVGREISETYNIIGMFVNTLALRNKIDNNLTYKNFALNIKDNLLEAYKYQSYPFDELVSKLGVKRDTSRSPLFDTMFIYQNNGYKDLSFKNIKAEYYIPDTGISKFDISLEVIPNDNHINLCFEFDINLYEQYFIENMANHYLNILNIVLENYNTKISDICILSKEEQDKVLYMFNDTIVEYPKNKTIVELFDEQARKTPDNVALVFENKELSYKELSDKVNSLATFLRLNENIGRNDLVGIMCNRSLEMIISILAVLKAGGAYIPIDPTYPRERIDYMLNSSNAKILLTLQNLYKTIDYKKKICVDLQNNTVYQNLLDNLDYINKPDDLAYVIFTSGSTGTPKGVMLKHKALSNLTNYCNNYIEYLKSPEYQAIVSITTVSFDIFIFETLISLQKGLKLVLANEDEQNTPNLLNDLIEKHNVKIIQSTPSRMQIFLNNIHDMPAIKKLKYIILAGEQLPLNLITSLNGLCDSIIYNGYGPSETTVFSTLTKMDSDKITIGKPLDNTQIYILDNNLKPKPIGIPGEIYISGEGVGKGYLNNPVLTKRSFISNPFIANTLMYKTGDYGLYDKNGDIVCLGRIDSQVKIRGLRIELEEIESLIQKYPNIKKTIVLKQLLNDREYIFAYFVANKIIRIDELKNYLSEKLPRYMVPSYFIPLVDLPYTPNGKIDRKALPLPSEILNISKEAYIAPTTKVQKELVAIWEKLLNTKPIGINDNFFELGGDSLLAMSLNVELLKISNTITYQDIFRYPTISELEQKIYYNDDTPLFRKIENLSDNCVNVLKNSTKKDSPKRYHPKGILLTGASGYLGIHILEEFIKKEKCNIYCIVRDTPKLTARAKLHQKLNYYFGNKYDNLLDNRIFAITGNISEPGFGLNQEDLLNIANSIDLVVNSAAIVSHFGNYSTFYKSNVTSVKYLIDFCKSFNKKLYHISTVSVSGNNLDLSYPSNSKKKTVNFDESSLYVGQILDNVYTRSKFEAESYILTAINEGLDAYLLRMGHLMPRYKDGVFQENAFDNALLSKIATFAKLRVVPEYLLNDLLEFTPVDFAAKAIYKLISHPTKNNRIFHLFNHNTVFVKKLVKLFNKKAYNIETLSESDFVKKIDSMLNNEDSRNILKNLIDDFDNNLHLDYNSDIILKSDFTIKYLRKTYFKWPRISNRYLIRFINLLRKVI